MASPQQQASQQEQRIRTDEGEITLRPQDNGSVIMRSPEQVTLKPEQLRQFTDKLQGLHDKRA